MSPHPYDLERDESPRRGSNRAPRTGSSLPGADRLEHEPTEVISEHERGIYGEPAGYYDAGDPDRTQVLGDDRTQVLDADRTEVLGNRRSDVSGERGFSADRGFSAEPWDDEAGHRAASQDGRATGGYEPTQVLEPEPRQRDAWEADDERTRVLDPEDARIRPMPSSGAPGGQQSSWQDPAAGPIGATAGAGHGYAQEHPGAEGFDRLPPSVPQGPTGAELRTTVVRQQKAEYARLQLIPGLIGWLVALGVATFFISLGQRFGGNLGIEALPPHPASLISGVETSSLPAGSAGAWALALGIVYFLAYLVGGYAAGRAARFSGAKQGLAVFLWILMGTAVSTVLNMIFSIVPEDGPFLVSAQALGGDDLMAGILGAVAIAVIGLVAAILGGLWGTRYHRRVDRWGFEGR